MGSGPQDDGNVKQGWVVVTNVGTVRLWWVVVPRMTELSSRVGLWSREVVVGSGSQDGRNC